MRRELILLIVIVVVVAMADSDRRVRAQRGDPAERAPRLTNRLTPFCATSPATPVRAV
jgi:hypothetical protein